MSCICCTFLVIDEPRLKRTFLEYRCFWEAMCKKHGFQFSWMDEERERMCKESIGHLGGKAWQERVLAALVVVDAVLGVLQMIRRGLGSPFWKLFFFFWFRFLKCGIELFCVVL